jgi:drug/metabolite transporter (DMT)-like permease
LFLNLLPGGILPGGATAPSDFFWLGDAVAGWVILFLLAAGPTVLGFGLYNVSLSLLPSSVANLIVTLEPAFTTFIAYLVLNERLNEVQIQGSLMILASVVLLRIYEGRLAGQPETTAQEQIA